MLRANTENKRSVSISEAIRSGVYFCPVCGEKLIVKGHYLEPTQGHQRKHFAHLHSDNSTCPITISKREYESNDKSEWHIEWQSKFDISEQEYWMNDIQGCFRADIYLESLKRVIEFQHSNLPIATFEKRNAFYLSKGMTIIWLFDFDSLKKDGRIEEITDLKAYEYSEPNLVRLLNSSELCSYTLNFYNKKFGTFKPQECQDVQLFFSYTEDGVTYFRKIVYVNDSYSKVITQVIEKTDDFLMICRSDTLSTPVETITHAMAADKKHIEDIKEEKRHALIVRTQIERFIEPIVRADVYSEEGKTEQLKGHLLSRADGTLYATIENYSLKELQIMYDRLFRKYQQSFEKLDRTILKVIDSFLKKKYLTVQFLSTARESDIPAAWDYVETEVKKLYTDEDIEAILNHHKGNFVKYLNRKIKQFPIEDAKRISGLILANEDLDQYTFDTFVSEVWKRLPSEERAIITTENIRGIDNLYVNFMRAQERNRSARK